MSSESSLDSFSSFLAARVTEAPHLESHNATAYPIPCVLPQTTACFPAKSLFIFLHYPILLLMMQLTVEVHPQRPRSSRRYDKKLIGKEQWLTKSPRVHLSKVFRYYGQTILFLAHHLM